MEAHHKSKTHTATTHHTNPRPRPLVGETMPRSHIDKHKLIDAVKDFFEVTADHELATILRVQPSAISKIRRGTNKISALFILRIHLLTEVPVKELLSYCKKDEVDI
jgi:transcriptional regulator with XRE-family HTH domain